MLRDIVLSSFSRATTARGPATARQSHADRSVARLLPAERCGSLQHWDVVLAVDGQLLQGKSRDHARRILQRSVRNATRAEGGASLHAHQASPSMKVHGGSHRHRQQRLGVVITVVRRPQRYWKVLNCPQCSVACLHDLRKLKRVMHARRHARVRGVAESSDDSADEQALHAACCSCGTVAEI